MLAHSSLKTGHTCMHKGWAGLLSSWNRLSLLVVEGNGTSLLCQDWLSKVCFDCKKILVANTHQSMAKGHRCLGCYNVSMYICVCHTNGYGNCVLQYLQTRGSLIVEMPT